MKSFIKLLFLGIIVIIALNDKFINAQIPSIKFAHITIDNGLSQSTVISVLQDRKGFMWFGTQDGLNKFDGYSFTIYKYDPFDSTTISDNYIRCIYEDKLGTLWIGTENGGLNRFNRDKETFERYLHDPNNPNSIANNNIAAISEDEDGMLWIGTRGNDLEKFDIQNNRFIHIKYDPHSHLEDDQIRCMYRDKKGIFWIGTENSGLKRYDPGSRNVENFQHRNNDPTSITNNTVNTIWKDDSGNLWVCTKMGLNLFDRQTKTFTGFPLLLNGKWAETTSILEDESGRLWIGTMAGMILFEPGTKTYQYYQNDPNNLSSYSSSGALTLYKDKTGLVWIGTNGGGVDRLNLSQKFKYYTHISTEPSSISHTSIRAIFEDQDSVLWVGSYGGLDKFDRKTDKIIHYKFNPDNPNSLNNNNVYAIVGDYDGTLWVGTEGGGLNHFDPQSEKFTQFIHDVHNPNSLSGHFIFELLLDNSGDLWIGSEAGLSLFTNENKPSSHFINYAFNMGKITVNSIIRDYQGYLWIGSETAGLIRFDDNTESFIQYTHDPQNAHSLSSDRIKCLYQDVSGNLWIGTNGGGLDQFDFTSQSFRHYSVKDGLPNDIIYGILEDKQGNLWLSSNMGLSRFDAEAESFRNYDIDDGLQSNEFNTGAFYKSWTGEMFFGGISGLNAFFPDRIKDNTQYPPIVVTDFQILNESVPIGAWKNDRTILHKSITETDALTLSHRDRVFSFMFAALDFSAPDKNQYAYKMDGIDLNWNYTKASKRFATYTHLPAGNYTFKVKGTNQDGVWNEAGKSIPIKITPPFWKTWWAYIFYGISIISLFLVTIQWRLKQVKNQRALLKKQVDERTVEIQGHKKEIEHQNEFLHSVIESLSQPFYVIDAKNFKTVLQNSAAKEKVEIGGMYCHSLLFGNEKPCSHSGHYCPLPDVKRNKQLVTHERSHVDENGKTTYTQISAFPVFDEEGNVAQMIEYWTDITARKELENKLKENLVNRNKILTSRAMRMSRDREILIEIVADIQSLYNNNKSKEKSKLKQITEKLTDQINAGTEWDEFDLWFQEVHSDFYDKLKTLCSDMTTRELKICAFLKLNLNTKEIASLTNLTVKTIEVYRSQLRKKLNIQRGDNLVKFISDL